MPINLLNGKYAFWLFLMIFKFNRTTAFASAIIHLYVFRFRSVNILPVVFIIYNKKRTQYNFPESILVFQKSCPAYFLGRPTGTLKYFVFADRGGVILLKNKEQKEQDFL